MEPLKITLTGAALATSLWLVQCAHSKDAPDCPEICNRLAHCSYLPSVLGASNSSVDGGVNAEAEQGCLARCDISTQGDDYKLVDDCYQADPDCEAFGACLQGRFPGTPITGLSDLTLSADLRDAGSAGSPDCDPDAGSTVRAFVRSWGSRVYGETRVCGGAFRQFFPGVPAETDTSVGLQFLSHTRCQEISHAESIPAGASDLIVALSVDAKPASCAIEPNLAPGNSPSSGAAGDSGDAP